MPWLLGAFLAVLVGVGTFAWSFVDRFNANAALVVQLQARVQLLGAREASHRRMIERRDAAINASECKAKINHWVRNPDEVPKPFNPFNQLD